MNRPDSAVTGRADLEPTEKCRLKKGLPKLLKLELEPSLTFSPRFASFLLSVMEIPSRSISATAFLEILFLVFISAFPFPNVFNADFSPPIQTGQPETLFPPPPPLFAEHRRHFLILCLELVSIAFFFTSINLHALGPWLEVNRVKAKRIQEGILDGHELRDSEFKVPTKRPRGSPFGHYVEDIEEQPEFEPTQFSKSDNRPITPKMVKPPPSFRRSTLAHEMTKRTSAAASEDPTIERLKQIYEQEREENNQPALNRT
ncbi:hypothetical protein Taro_015118 [Colocasia esculenta]|uniref:Uncharacterized protein n=1 Tax=Colocasia esculenta TaxID=4460 RepID=A0A843ULB7_COLES|nr:hypothetical protein [Colocasia esculenta]